MPTGEPAGSIPNVGPFWKPIKGEADPPTRHCERSDAIQQQAPLFFEQLVRGAAVAGSISEMLLNPPNLGLEQLDALVKFIDRQRPEILLDQLCQRVLRLAGKEVVLVHCAESLTHASAMSISPRLVEQGAR